MARIGILSSVRSMRAGMKPPPPIAMITSGLNLRAGSTIFETASWIWASAQNGSSSAGVQSQCGQRRQQAGHG